MVDFGVPVPYREALIELASLPEDEFQRLVDELVRLPAFAHIRELGDAAARALGGTADEAAGLVLPLLSLRGQVRNMSADRIAEALSRSADLDLSNDEARSRLGERVASILRTEALSTTAVGVELLTQFSTQLSGLANLHRHPATVPR